MNSQDNSKIKPQHRKIDGEITFTHAGLNISESRPTAYSVPMERCVGCTSYKIDVDVTPTAYYCQFDLLSSYNQSQAVANGKIPESCKIVPVESLRNIKSIRAGHTGYTCIDDTCINDTDYSSCQRCGSDEIWEDCWSCDGQCGQDGDELMSEDPLWYSPDDFRICDVCQGKGGFYVCINSTCTTEDNQTNPL